MTELLWWRVKIQPIIELPRRSTNLQWTCQPKMQPVFVCHCQLACKRSTDLSDEDYDAAPWRLIAATRTMHILSNVLPIKSSFDANCWAVERCGMIVAMHRSSEMIQEEKPEYKPNICRFLTILPSNFLFSGAWFDPRRLQESQSNDCDCYASRHLFMNPNKSSSLLGQGVPMTLEDNPNWNTNQDNLGTWQWWRFVKSTHTWLNAQFPNLFQDQAVCDVKALSLELKSVRYPFSFSANFIETKILGTLIHSKSCWKCPNFLSFCSLLRPNPTKLSPLLSHHWLLKQGLPHISFKRWYRKVILQYVYILLLLLYTILVSVHCTVYMYLKLHT